MDINLIIQQYVHILKHHIVAKEYAIIICQLNFKGSGFNVRILFINMATDSTL